MSSPPRAPHVRGDDALLENDVPMATSHNPLTTLPADVHAFVPG